MQAPASERGYAPCNIVVDSSSFNVADDEIPATSGSVNETACHLSSTTTSVESDKAHNVQSDVCGKYVPSKSTTDLQILNPMLTSLD